MAKIVNISEAVSIALHSMVIIARQGTNEKVNVNVLADKTGSSKFHISKVMQKLVKDGYLLSNRGPSGGFYLAKKPEDISFLQLYESIEGKMELHDCPINHEVCPFKSCIFEDVTVKMTRDFYNHMKNRSLDYYIKSNKF
ncbi:MAG: Rrf2 family transcriptional regulator [Bacteroidales bacterium]|nr:Rrf2 family transcriptional regulator [Bacteroidales bacterium]